MSMKVFNLRCAHDHAFEGWFGSAEDFDSQAQRGLVECPVCGDRAVSRLPSAPRLNLSGAQATGQPPAQATPTAEQLQALWLKVARHIRESTEDVGQRFAEEARRIHYREAPARGIRGVATSEEAESLADEGIEVFSFPMPKGPEGPLQ
jgi:hypothetical protein